MSSNQWLSILLVALALLLPMSALLQRRIGVAKIAAMAFGWGVLFVAATLLFQFLVP